MDADEVERILEGAELVACLQAPLRDGKELRDACLAAEIPVVLDRGACCQSGGGCGCAPKVELYARPEDAPLVARLVQDRWRELALREGTLDGMIEETHAGKVDGDPATAAPGDDGDLPCPACGAAAPLVNGACTDCGLQLE